MFSPPNVLAVIHAGDVEISGGVEAQQLFRLDRSPRSQIDTFDIVQQRNTVRLQYAQRFLAASGQPSAFPLPWIRQISLSAYYRFVYDSVYDIAPGPYLRVNDGSIGGKFAAIPGRSRADFALENVLREIYVDVQTSSPLVLRIGRQQIVWGNTLNFRALDSVNPLDLTWHLQQESGLLGDVGLSELRVPQFAIKALYPLGSIGPLSGVLLEAYDIPFQFQPTKLRFSPAPFSLPIRNPFRPGLVVDVGTIAAGTPTGLLLEPCFDFTGNAAPNSVAHADFRGASSSGSCPSAGLPRSRLSRGLYRAHDPRDVNQFGARVGLTLPPGVGVHLSYLHRRHIVDATGGALAKTQVGALNSDPLGFVQPGIHSTTDPLTGRVSPLVLGFLRVPVEIYYPYVHVAGLSLNYFDTFTAAAYDLEVAVTHGTPIATANPHANGIRLTDDVEAAFQVNRPTWIRLLNPAATWSLFLQVNASILPDHRPLRRGSNGQPTDGDVGLVTSTVIPGQFRDLSRLDSRRQVEPLTLLAATTRYRGGSVAPLLVWIADWNNFPAMELQTLLEILPTPNLILDAGARWFWTNGRTVDDRFLIGSLAGRSELQLKLTVQF